MPSTAIGLDVTFAPAGLVIEDDDANVLNSAALASNNGTALFEVDRTNFNATISISGSDVTFCPFVFYSDRSDDITTNNDNWLAGINFPSTAALNANFINSATKAIISSFTTSKNGTGVTIDSGATTLEKTPANCHRLNLGEALFGTYKGADLFELPSTYYTDIDALQKTALEAVFSALDGVWVNSSGTVVFAKSGSTHTVGDTLITNPALQFMTHFLKNKPSLFADISTSDYASALTTTNSNLHSDTYPSTNHFNVPFFLAGSANSSGNAGATDMTFKFLITLDGTNQTDLTSSGATAADKTSKFQIDLNVV